VFKEGGAVRWGCRDEFGRGGFGYCGRRGQEFGSKNVLTD
jgi:hypothetical protein